jgi:hypothetical protein
MEPYGTPEQYRQQQELEEERYLSSMQALAYFSRKVTDKIGADHLAHLRSEAGITERELNFYLTKKEAA